MESFLHGFSIKSFETFHSTVGHHNNSIHNLLLILPNKLQPQIKQQSKMSKNIRFRPFHQFYIILCQFEWSSLEVHVAGTGGNHETEVYVDNVAHCVDKDVVVVSIFDLEQILDQWVTCKRLDEICQRLFPIYPKYLLVDSSQRFLLWLLFKITHSSCVVHKLYQTRIMVERDHIIWTNPKF